LEQGLGAARIEEHRDQRCRRGDLLEELEPLGDQIGVRVRKARDVCARARQARDEPLANGIGGDREDDRDRAGKLLRLEPRSIDDQDIDLETEELFGQLGKPSECPAAWRCSMMRL